MLIRLLSLALLVSPLYPALASNGDVLLIDRTQRASSVDRPANGASMSAVEARYGQPEQRVAAVGIPPISRWVYADFTVYFEHDKVINAVVNRSSQQEIGPRTPAE